MSYGRSRSVVSATIANAGTVSSEVNVGSSTIVGIIMPAGWTAANIGLQALVAEPSALPKVPVWGTVVDQAGTDVVLATGPAAGEYVAIAPASQLTGLGRIKLVASAGQGAERIVQLVLVD